MSNVIHDSFLINYKWPIPPHYILKDLFILVKCVPIQKIAAADFILSDKSELYNYTEQGSALQAFQYNAVISQMWVNCESVEQCGPGRQFADGRVEGQAAVS